MAIPREPLQVQIPIQLKLRIRFNETLSLFAVFPLQVPIQIPAMLAGRFRANWRVILP